MRIFPFFHNLAILFYHYIIGNKTLCRPIRSVIIRVINKSDSAARSSEFVITLMTTDRIGLHSDLSPLLTAGKKIGYLPA